MLERCTECGEVRPLTSDGVCFYRSGCEHRVHTHEAVMRRLTDQMAALDPLPCGHNALDHANMRADLTDFLHDLREGREGEWT